MRAKLALLVTIFAVPSYAADPVAAIPETVVTATRIPTPVADIPAGVTVIDRAAIDAGGATTIADVLATVPGLHVSASGGQGGQASVFLRGTNSSHVLVLRDGMAVNDASDPSDAFNFGIDTLSDIERIEVIRGQMAALYGSGAIGGVINLISRRGTADAPVVAIDLSGGYPAAIAGSAFASGGTGPFDYALTLESQSRRGFDSTPRRMSIYTGTPEGFRDRIATANLGYTPIDGTRLSLFLRARETLFGFNTLGFPTFDAANSSGTTDSLAGRIGATSKLFEGRYETSLLLGHTQDDRRYRELLNVVDPNLAAEDNRYHAWRTDLQWNNTVHLPAATDLTFGYQHTIDTINVRVNDSFAGYPFTENARASMVSDAAHAGVSTNLWRCLTLTGQLRQDWIGPNTPATWRVGSVLDVPEIDTKFKLAYGTAFRAPSLFERFGVDLFGTVGNATLKPERAEGWEIGFITTVPVHDATVTFAMTYFHQLVSDLITGVYAPISTWTNIGAAHLQGIETELTVRVAPFMSLHASHTFTDAIAVGQSAAIGSALLRRPRHAVEADAAITPMTGLKIVPQLIYTGPAHDYLYDNQGFGIGYGVGQQGLVANLTVSYDLTPHVRLHLDGTNLFGSRFEPVNGYQMPGTAVLAGARVHW